MYRVIPELPGDTFTQADIKEKILERWPELNPKTLANRISQLLKILTSDGYLERVSKGPRIQDPWHYRVRENQEGNLLGPP